MINPQHSPQLKAMERDIDDTLREAIGRPRPRPVAAPPPASSDATPGIEMWGPSHPRATSPLELLGQVAENTARLQEQLEQLVTRITGEQPPVKRLQQAPLKAGGLLPAISLLAHRIDEAHADLSRLINHVARQL